MSNSSLVNYTNISPNKSVGRNHKIDTITIHCLPEQRTEVLTKKGWVNIGKVLVGDEIATSDNMCNIKFDKVLNTVPIHKDSVFNFSTGFSGTKDHRVLIKKQYDLKNNNPYKDAIVEEVIDSKSNYYLPSCGNYNSSGLNISNEEINFICAVQADGCYELNKNGEIISIRFRFWKKRKIEEFSHLISLLGYSYDSAQIYGTKNYKYGIEFKTFDKEAIKLCNEFLDNKMFNYRLLEMTNEQVIVFIDSLVKWDGHLIEKENYTEKRYISHKKQNIDVVTAVCSIHNVGYRIDNKSTITFKEKTYRTFGRKKPTQTVENVTCVSVPSSYILIRQNGRSSIVGNCMAGNLSIETCGNLFARSSTQASSNYGIGSDGRIGLYVEEKDRSWATSSGANDNRAVTIEVANDGGAPNWHVSDKALNSLIKLVADICKRNGIKKLLWKNDKSLIGQTDKQNMTVHRWFANKACPGEYLMSKHGYIADEVNKLLGGNGSTSTATTTPKDSLYRVRKSWKNSSTQLGAFHDLKSAKNVAKKNKGYKVFDENGKQVYPVTKKYSGGFPIIPPSLKKKSIGLQVERLQKYLNWYGDYNLVVDGSFGTKTYSAVLDFQKKNGLTVDGIFGTASLKKAKAIKK